MLRISSFLFVALCFQLTADAFQMSPLLGPTIRSSSSLAVETSKEDVVSRRDLGSKLGNSAAVAAAGVFGINSDKQAAYADEEEGKLIEFLVENVSGEPGQTGRVVIRTKPSWSPNGVTRFEKLTEIGFWDGCRIFRVLPGFIVSTRAFKYSFLSYHHDSK